MVTRCIKESLLDSGVHDRKSKRWKQKYVQLGEKCAMLTIAWYLQNIFKLLRNDEIIKTRFTHHSTRYRLSRNSFSVRNKLRSDKLIVRVTKQRVISLHVKPLLRLRFHNFILRVSFFSGSLTGWRCWNCSFQTKHKIELTNFNLSTISLQISLSNRFHVESTGSIL